MRPSNLGLAGSSQSGHSTGPDQVVFIKCRAFLKMARTRRKGASSHSLQEQGPCSRIT